MSTPHQIPTRPKLRDGLRRSPRGDDSGQLVVLDPDTGAMLVLSAPAARLLEALDGVTPIDVAAREAFVAPDEAHAVVRALAEHLMLADDESLRRRRALLLHRVERARIGRGQLRVGPGGAPGEEDAPLEVSSRPGLRWSCIGCGACCSGRFGLQLDAGDEATLRTLDLRGALGFELDDVLVWPMPAPLPDERPWLRTRDGLCVFLGDDGLCELHKRFGAAAKPAACRAFPFEAMRTPDGALLRYRPECSGQARTATSGAPIDAGRAAALYRELLTGADGVLEVPDAPLVLRSDRLLDWPTWRSMERGWRERIADEGWRAGLTAMREASREPTDEDDPAPEPLEQVLLLDVARRRAFDQLCGVQATTPLRGLLGPGTHGTATIVELLHGTFAALRATLPAPRPPWPATPTDEALELTLDPLHALRPLPDEQRDARPPDATLREALVRLADDEAAQKVLARYLQDALFGQYVLHAETLAAGCGLLALIAAAGLATAAWAHLARGRALDAEQLNEALVVWHLQVFGHSALRVDLQLELRDVLERQSVWPGLA